MRKRSELLFSLILIPIDFLAILAAFIAAYAIRVLIDDRPVAYPLGIEFFLQIFLIIVPVIILIFALSGLYNLSSLRGSFREFGKIFVAVSGGLMFMLTLDFVSSQPLFPSKSVPFYAYGLSIVSVTLGRQIIRQIQRALFRLNIGVYRVAIVGSGPIAQRLATSLSTTRTSGYLLVGAIDTAKGAQQRLKDVRVDLNLKNLLNRLGGPEIDEIIQADSSLSQDEILTLMRYSTTNHITYRFVPNQLGIFAAHSEIGTMAGMPVVAIKRTPLEGWGRIVKRVFDIVGSFGGLILLSPLFLVIAVLIKLSDPGPVFYRHRRLSREGKYIKVFKFRSMRMKFSTDPKFKGKNEIEIFKALGRDDLIKEWQADHKVKEDPRVSGIGNYLRRTSLDELPQLINILKGDISLVGPRPIVEPELERYGKEQSKLLALRPGLTGLWQVSGRNDIDYDERVKLDMYYVENWSILLDIRIILRTIVILFTGKGAY